MKPRVYVETTIPSYLTARPSRDLLVLARHQSTRDWWARRDEYQLFVSRLVLTECRGGDETAARDRIEVLTAIPLLDETPEIASLAEALIRVVRLPPKAESDATHIATAAFHGVDFLLTWNCTHIANAVFLPRIQAVCRAAECRPPVICTPEQLFAPEEAP